MEQQKYKLHLRLGLYGLLGFVAVLLLIAAILLVRGAPGAAAVAVASATPVAVKGYFVFLQSLGR